jgi:addiction module HigA family antidote
MGFMAKFVQSNDLLVVREIDRRWQLGALNAASNPDDMNFPGWGLHLLKGNLQGHYAVWVSKNWRMTFKFEGDDAVLVDYQDYHWSSLKPVPPPKWDCNLRPSGVLKMATMHNPPHPGRLLANYVKGHTVGEVAAHLGVTRMALSRVLNEHAAISAEMAVRIGITFNTDPGFWVRLQGQYDLWHATQKKIKAKPLSKAAA